MILATRFGSEGLDEKRPITEALQLQFYMSALRLGLMGSSPEGPCNDEVWLDSFSSEAGGDASHFPAWTSE